MYQTRESMAELEKCGEKPEQVEPLLEQLAELGWKFSYWGNCGEEGKKTFVEVFGKGKCRIHAKGPTIQTCYERALKQAQKIQAAEQQIQTAN